MDVLAYDQVLNELKEERRMRRSAAGLNGFKGSPEENDLDAVYAAAERVLNAYGESDGRHELVPLVVDAYKAAHECAKECIRAHFIARRKFFEEAFNLLAIHPELLEERHTMRMRLIEMESAAKEMDFSVALGITLVDRAFAALADLIGKMGYCRCCFRALAS